MLSGGFWAYLGVTWESCGPIGGYLDQSGCHLGHPGGHLGTTWEHLGYLRGHAGVQGELREGHVLQTFCFKLFLRHTKNPQDEPISFDEVPRRA